MEKNTKLLREVLSVPTKTYQEENEFLRQELIECAQLAEKSVAESYDAGIKEGIHRQFCHVQCGFLKRMKARVKEQAERVKADKNRKRSPAEKIDKMLGVDFEVTDDQWYQDQVDGALRQINSYQCDCTQTPGN
jgi:hypothetical protein